MAQKEMMMRTISDNSIVGYLQIDGADIWYHELEKGEIFEDDYNNWEWLEWYVSDYWWDSFELGVKVGDEWRFGEYIYDDKTHQYNFLESKIND